MSINMPTGAVMNYRVVRIFIFGNQPVQRITLISFLFLALMAGAVSAQQPLDVRKLVMELVWILETKAQIFVVGGVGFYAVTSLKKCLGEQPAGTVAEWNPGCVRIGGEPLLSSAKELNEFKTYLEKRKIKFVLVPSG
jgi:hypothetical protein